jgi:hypothetical protein
MTWKPEGVGLWRQESRGARHVILAYDDDAAPRVQPIHQRQQRAHYAVVYLVLLTAAHLSGNHCRSASASVLNRNLFM